MQSVLTLAREAVAALRSLAKAPAFLIPAVLTMAAGVGATAAVFALVDGVLLQPLPYPEAQRIVTLTHSDPERGFLGHSSSQIYAHYRGSSRTLENLGAYLETVVNVTSPGEPEQLDVALVAPSVLTILGVQPRLGRIFTPEEGEPEAPTNVIVSHGLWQTRFGADPAIVGRDIELNGRSRRIIGVMPPGFAFPARSTQIWYNFGPDPLSGSVSDLDLRVIARVRQGVTLDAAERDLRQTLATLQSSYGGSEADLLGGLRVSVQTLKHAVVGDVRQPLWILLGAVGLLLLAASANVVNLFLLRGEANQRAVAVRRALGARPARIRRRWLMESSIVAFCGGALGLALAAAAVAWQFGFQPGEIPRLDEVRLNLTTVAVAASIAILAALGVTAALDVQSRRSKISALLGQGRGVETSPSQQRVQKALVGAQVAFALVMLLGSVTASRGLLRVLDIDLGFNPENVATVAVRLPFGEYRTYDEAARFHEAFLDRIRNAPGVTAAAVVTNVPLTPVPDNFELPVVVTPGADETRALFLHATPSFFEAMRIPLVAGKLFEASDGSAGIIPVMISRRLAAQLAGGPEAAVGLRFREGSRERGSSLAVVGVVGDAVGEALTAPPGPIVYMPILSALPSDLDWPLTPRLTTAVVKTTTDPRAVATVLRRELRAIDPTLPLAEVQTMSGLVERGRARRRLIAGLLALSAGATLFLGVVGIYGVTSYFVSRRGREFAIRMALGSGAAGIHRLVFGSIAAMLGMGIGVGLALYALASRSLRSVAYGVEPMDAATVSATIMLLAAVALLAGYPPARRAARSDPAEAMRAE